MIYLVRVTSYDSPTYIFSCWEMFWLGHLQFHDRQHSKSSHLQFHLWLWHLQIIDHLCRYSSLMLYILSLGALSCQAAIMPTSPTSYRFRLCFSFFILIYCDVNFSWMFFFSLVSMFRADPNVQPISSQTSLQFSFEFIEELLLKSC